jgi:hypothetical protein
MSQPLACGNIHRCLGTGMSDATANRLEIIVVMGDQTWPYAAYDACTSEALGNPVTSCMVTEMRRLLGGQRRQCWTPWQVL